MISRRIKIALAMLLWSWAVHAASPSAPDIVLIPLDDMSVRARIGNFMPAIQGTLDIEAWGRVAREHRLRHAVSIHGDVDASGCEDEVSVWL